MAGTKKYKLVINVVGEACTGKSSIAHLVGDYLHSLGFVVVPKYADNMGHLQDLVRTKSSRLRTLREKLSEIEINEVQAKRGSMREQSGG